MAMLSWISGLLFVAGIAAYWIVSKPLSTLPNWNQIQHDKAKNQNDKT